MYIRKDTPAQYDQAAAYILSKIQNPPQIAIILGTDLSDFADHLQNPTTIPYADIPHFLQTTVKSHPGDMVFGSLEGKEVVCLKGRFHYYEGYDFEDLTRPVRLLKRLGVQTLILTNAAGAVNPVFTPGDLMVISDHIKLFGASPLRGPNDQSFGPRFFDISDMYSKKLRDLAKSAAKEAGIDLKEGVYMYFPGPQFESPAEIRAAALLGADAVGMSTVTEVLTAAHCQMPTLAISLISNMAAGLTTGPVTTSEVGETAQASKASFEKLLTALVRKI